MSDEDQSLGDFFAKKDKGKKTKKSKKKTKSSDNTDTPTEVTHKSQVDEWNDFEEEKEKDYSNLKIQSLQVNDETKEEEPESIEEDIEGVPIEKPEKSGIWNTPTQSQPTDSTNSMTGKIVDGKYVPPSQKASAAIPSPSIPSSTPGAYVPPSLRGSTTPNVASGAYVPPSLRRSTMAEAAVSSASKRRNAAPPDISNQAMFPTLGAANQDLNSPQMSSDFEMVKRGAKTNDARMDENRPNLNLGNRFDGLRS